MSLAGTSRGLGPVLFFTDFRNKLVFDPGKLMQSSLMFVGDERRLP